MTSLLDSLTDETKAAILDHAMRVFPHECCGFVMCDKGKETYLEVKNLHEKPTDFFRLDPDELLPVLSGRANLRCFVHSHPNGLAAPSSADRVLCENLAVPFIIVSLPDTQWSETFPEGWTLPLVGREFQHGTIDCYSLCRDYYRQKLKIDLPDFYREDNWWLKGKNYYINNIAPTGFTLVSDLRIHDMLLFTAASPVPNHAAIYVGDGLILHHVPQRLSCHQPLGGFWLKNHYATIRHHSLCPSSQ